MSPRNVAATGAGARQLKTGAAARERRANARSLMVDRRRFCVRQLTTIDNIDRSRGKFSALLPAASAPIARSVGRVKGASTASFIARSARQLSRKRSIDSSVTSSSARPTPSRPAPPARLQDRSVGGLGDGRHIRGVGRRRRRRGRRSCRQLLLQHGQSLLIEQHLAFGLPQLLLAAVERVLQVGRLPQRRLQLAAVHRRGRRCRRRARSFCSARARSMAARRSTASP